MNNNLARITSSFQVGDRVVINPDGANRLTPQGIGKVVGLSSHLVFVNFDYARLESETGLFSPADLELYRSPHNQSSQSFVDCGGRYYEVPSAEPPDDDLDEDGWEVIETWEEKSDREDASVFWTEF